MARLHHKKGIVPLVKAWLASPQGQSSQAHLYIAGPDDGELASIQQLLSGVSNPNITYTGPVYNEEKQKLIDQCHIYLLPSHSEGFPTSVLEAMNNQLLAVITSGCNFPEAMEGNYALQTTPHENDILQTLKTIRNTPTHQLQQQAHAGTRFIQHNYSLE